MKRLKKLLSAMLVFGIVLSSFGQVFASSKLIDTASKVEFSDDFENWRKLSDEEKSKILQPNSMKIYETKFTSKNPVKLAQTVGSATLAKFSLRDYIPENLVIKNQGQTTSCWAFASLGMLETTLALSDYYNDEDVQAYDYSERHMEYATSRVFLNDEINLRGLNRKVGDGGNYYVSMPYMLSELGPVAEKDLPFENDQSLIELSKIQNKEKIAQIVDTRLFATDTADKTVLIKDLKEHIKKYGGIEAHMHGADLFSDSYNIETGAIYTANATTNPPNHDVVLIGWDDNYSLENFNEGSRPTKNGAWIVKNSWGTKVEATLEEILINYYL